MTYYCEKCGHKLGKNKHRCAFCGAFQMWDSDAHYDTKKCKKCGRKIYVNANYCPYCGADQATLDPHRDLSDSQDNEVHEDNKSGNQPVTQYYCEKCGHKVGKNEKHCAFCGALQMRLSGQHYETKNCKKCGRKIYVNANFCPYCGTDQAILNLHCDLEEDKKEEEKEKQEAEKNMTPQQRIMQNLMNLNLNDPESLEDFVKKMDDVGVKVRVIKPEEKNETVTPGLVKSTKLMFRDMFKINKRMGINDYWWGFLGIMLILIVFSFFVPQILLMMHVSKRIIETIVFGVAIFFQFILMTATWRRLHDANYSNWWMLLWLIPFGTIVLYIMCMTGPRLDNNPYTFKVKDWQNRQRKM